MWCSCVSLCLLDTLLLMAKHCSIHMACSCAKTIYGLDTLREHLTVIVLGIVWTHAGAVFLPYVAVLKIAIICVYLPMYVHTYIIFLWIRHIVMCVNGLKMWCLATASVFLHKGWWHLLNKSNLYMLFPSTIPKNKYYYIRMSQSFMYVDRLNISSQICHCMCVHVQNSSR